MTLDFPNEILFSFLSENCILKNSIYIFNYDAYKKANYNNNIEGFISKCVPYYNKTQMKYLERKMTYNHFTTILRQICNRNQIPFTKQLKYEQSKYTITYYITYINH